MKQKVLRGDWFAGRGCRVSGTILWAVLTLVLQATPLLYGAPRTWDKEGAASCFRQAWNRQQKLGNKTTSNPTKQEYQRIIRLYEQVWLRDPHLSRSDDAMFYVAQLWKIMGDTFHDKRYYQNSWDRIQVLLREYPKTSFRSSAHLEAAMALEKLGQPGKANEQLQLVIGQFPKTKEAQKAKTLLVAWEPKLPAPSAVSSKKEKEGNESRNPVAVAAPVSIADAKVESQAPEEKIKATDGSAITSSNSSPEAEQVNGSNESPVTQGAKAQTPMQGGLTLTRTLGLKIHKIVIDPGHGGHNTGTISKSGLMEKNLVLQISLLLRRLLQDRLNAEVIMTRESDVFVPLEERTAIANRHKADLFISIHANHSSNRKVNGVETFFLHWAQNKEDQELATRENAFSTSNVADLENLVKAITRSEKRQESKDFAGSVQSHLHRAVAKISPGAKNRGVKQAPFVVLIGAAMPSILAEVAFLSHPKTASRLAQEKSKTQIAASLCRGIEEYVKSLNGQDGIADSLLAASD